MIPTREAAYRLLTEYNKNDALVKHALAVEGVMRHFARYYGENAELWGIVGLLHDLDYEQFPDEHCTKTAEILRERGIDEIIVRACASHGFGICSDIEPESLMEKTLYTIDELTGLVNASALMRPNRSVMDLELKSLKKKFKTRSFAAGVDRDLIEKGAEKLGLPMDTVMTETILGMREVADELGLAGS